MKTSKHHLRGENLKICSVLGWLGTLGSGAPWETGTFEVIDDPKLDKTKTEVSMKSFRGLLGLKIIKKFQWKLIRSVQVRLELF